MIYLVIVLNANRMCGKTSRFCSLFNETYYTGFTVFGVGAARMINAYWSVSQASLTRSTQRSFVMRTAHESSPHPTGSFTLMKLLWDIIPTANATRLRTRARHCDSRVITNCNLVIKFYNGSEKADNRQPIRDLYETKNLWEYCRGFLSLLRAQGCNAPNLTYASGANHP